jgi:methylmalonyl-CoA/ethylmalonyl-CoA epimerase
VDGELLEITEPEMRRRRMDCERQAHIEHIGIKVEDVDAAVAELQAQGVRMSTERPYGGGGWRYYFTDPSTTDGIVYQFFETRRK